MGRPDYEPIGGPENVSQVNPMADPAFNRLTNEANFLREMFAGQISDPDAALAAFLGHSGDLASLALGTASPFARAQLGLVEEQADEAIQQVLQATGKTGTLYSGGAFEDITRAAMLPRQQAIANITGLQTNLASQLFGLGGQLIGQGYGQAMQSTGALYGDVLRNITALGAPEFYEPAYADMNAPRRELLGGLIGGGATLLGGILGGPIGAGIGARIANPNRYQDTVGGTVTAGGSFGGSTGTYTGFGVG